MQVCIVENALNMAIPKNEKIDLNEISEPQNFLMPGLRAWSRTLEAFQSSMLNFAFHVPYSGNPLLLFLTFNSTPKNYENSTLYRYFNQSEIFLYF